MKRKLQFTGAALVVAIKGYFVEKLMKLNSQTFETSIIVAIIKDRDLIVQ